MGAHMTVHASECPIQVILKILMIQEKKIILKNYLKIF